MKNSLPCFAALAAVASVVVLSGCSVIFPTEDTRPLSAEGERLNRIPGVNAVEIPAGVTDAQALDAVERAVESTYVKGRWSPWVSKWTPELRDSSDKWIRLGFTLRRHYLCVCYRIEDGKLIPDVPTSQNLKQNGTRIHRKVPQWINSLNTLISQQLYAAKKGTVQTNAK